MQLDEEKDTFSITDRDNGKNKLLSWRDTTHPVGIKKWAGRWSYHEVQCSDIPVVPEVRAKCESKVQSENTSVLRTTSAKPSIGQHMQDITSRYLHTFTHTYCT
jgi:hypothetical protein